MLYHFLYSHLCCAKFCHELYILILLVLCWITQNCTSLPVHFDPNKFSCSAPRITPWQAAFYWPWPWFQGGKQSKLRSWAAVTSHFNDDIILEVTGASHHWNPATGYPAFHDTLFSAQSFDVDLVVLQWLMMIWLITTINDDCPWTDKTWTLCGQGKLHFL